MKADTEIPNGKSNVLWPNLYIALVASMAGYILGTGSGVLAAAAVYYTMSAHLAQDTTALQAE
jgi:hypothetical protein